MPLSPIALYNRWTLSSKYIAAGLNVEKHSPNRVVERITRADDVGFSVAAEHFLIGRADLIHHLADVVVRRPAVIAAAERIWPQS